MCIVQRIGVCTVEACLAPRSEVGDVHLVQIVAVLECILAERGDAARDVQGGQVATMIECIKAEGGAISLDVESSQVFTVVES